jgi:ABC-type taurine transport system substrate-binding protein
VAGEEGWQWLPEEVQQGVRDEVWAEEEEALELQRLSGELQKAVRGVRDEVWAEEEEELELQRLSGELQQAVRDGARLC